MKAKIFLEKGETLVDAEETLEKALKRKQECSGGERYCDPAVNEFHDYVEERHESLVQNTLKDLTNAIERDVYSKE